MTLLHKLLLYALLAWFIGMVVMAAWSAPRGRPNTKCSPAKRGVSTDAPSVGGIGETGVRPGAPGSGAGGLELPASTSPQNGQQSGHAQSLIYPRKLYDAMRQVESGGNDRAVGDCGKSYGPYQITRNYWTDACAKAGIAADWKSGRWDRNCSEWVMFWYARRYEPDALRQGACEILARLHNGGPRWRAVKNEWYWKRVKEAMR